MPGFFLRNHRAYILLCTLSLLFISGFILKRSQEDQDQTIKPLRENAKVFKEVREIQKTAPTVKTKTPARMSHKIHEEKEKSKKQTTRSRVNVVKKVGKSNARQPVETSMTVIMQARLGNNMFQYAALVGVAAARGNIPIYLNDGNGLRRIFNITAKGYPDIEHDKRVTKNSNRYNENCCLYDPKLIKNVNIGGSFVLNGFFQNWRYFHPHASDRLRREFVFRKNVLDEVQSFLTSVGEKYLSKLTPPSEQTAKQKLTYVGVHVRRGDITNHRFHDKIGMRQPTMDYFNKAMALMERLYKNIIYVVCSDDLNWCRKMFGHMSNIAYCPGKDRIVDLAILAKSNHSILTVGSFGFWGAFLANGTTTYFGSARALNSESDRMFSYDQYFMPNWIKIP